MTDPAHGYYEVIAPFYDYIPGNASRSDLAFYRSVVTDDALELGCGTGRVLRALAELGKPVVGVDRSDAMLQICRARCAGMPNVSVVAGDLRRVRLDRRFSTVIVPHRTFSYLHDLEDQLAGLATAAHHLRPGGRLCFDVVNPAVASLTAAHLTGRRVAEPVVHLPDGTQMVRRLRVLGLDWAEQRLQIGVSCRSARGEQTALEDLRLFFRWELHHLLARAGFVDVRFFGDFDRSPHTETAPEIVVEATWPGEQR